MFVEGPVEIKVKDRSAAMLDEHGLKLWVKGAFRDGCCYRISDFLKSGPKLLEVTVALDTAVLPAHERKLLEGHPDDLGSLRAFLERMFIGKGSCRSVGSPSLKSN